jgi:beta-glucosidase
MSKRFACVIALWAVFSQARGQQRDIYHKGWIDFNKNGIEDVYENPSMSLDARVKDLVSRMTLDEKTCQLATLYGYGRVLKDEQPTAAWKDSIWKDGIANIDEDLTTTSFRPETLTKYSYPFSRHAEAINRVQRWFVEQTRLGIPVDFTNEGAHGLASEKATPLPAQINVGSTWDRRMAYQAGRIEGREARALGYTNVYAPLLDVSRDPRWGRVVETYGESPFLIAELGKQMVLGIQSEHAASTLKHFAVYSVPKGGRDGRDRTDPHVAPRELFDMYLYPFRRVIREAAPLGVMSSYNDWNGEPVTGSYYFLTELLRQRFGFKGYVVSDSKAVGLIHERHRVADTYKEAVRQAITAGLDVRTDFNSPATYIVPLRELVREGRVPESVLDARVSDVLRVKFELGLFDQPYVADPMAADSTVHTAADEAFALRLNQESMVLLKNEGSILPLDPAKRQRILVTGPLAAASHYAISRYGPSRNQVTTILDGIRGITAGHATVDYAPGCAIKDSTWPESEILPTPLSASEKRLIFEAVAKARRSDVVIAVMGEGVDEVGEGLSRTSLGLPGRQLQLLQALYQTGKPVVVVLVNGQPLTINWADRYIPAILEAWFPGPQAGTAVATTLFGQYNPGGKLPMTFPKTVGQIALNFPYKPGSQTPQPGGRTPAYGKTRVNGPLYPFGYGLSYTTFSYRNLAVTPDTQRTGGKVEVSVDVTNTGSRAGDAVVELYVTQKWSDVTIYESQLRGFERVSLSSGQTRRVKFLLSPDDLSMMDKHMDWRVEPGEFIAKIGSSSRDIQLEKTFTMVSSKQ